MESVNKVVEKKEKAMMAREEEEEDVKVDKEVK
jgi:hypothetical protein